MIEEIRIRGLGVIEDVTLELAPGLTVVTGETGAGKTMVVTALQLLLGARGSTSLVRAGADAALVEARVTPPPADPDAGLVPDEPVRAQDPADDERIGVAAWLEDGEDEVVVSREVRREGRGRARVNGRMAPVSALSRVLGAEVEVHAQHEHVRLSRPEVQRHLLDGYAGEAHAEVLATYRAVHARLLAVRERVDELTSDAQARARAVDRLRHEVGEIDALALTPDDDGLDARLRVLEDGEQHRTTAMQAAAALGSEAAGTALGEAVAGLRRVADQADDASVDALRDRAEGLAAEATELAVDVRSWAEDLDVDEATLDELRERVAAIAALARKYGPDVAAILAYRDEAQAELDVLDTADHDVVALRSELDQLDGEARELAAGVTAGRRSAAERLAEQVGSHLADLGMALASFRVEVAPRELGANGADAVAFLLAANPGEAGGPFADVASGGERSRVALAVTVALADVHDAQVLVFDEVDAGIGGATAMQVGAKLATLTRGGRRQVLCVTHLAQLAAHADVHWVAEKGLVLGDGGEQARTVTTLRRVDVDTRADELHRLLSGDAGGEAGRTHARELLAAARATAVA